jgi:hypothetical protein
MAIGDIGAAHGFPAIASSGNVNLGYQDVNQVQDYLGTEVDNRVAGDAANAARTPVIIVSNTPMTTGTANGTLRFW